MTLIQANNISKSYRVGEVDVARTGGDRPGQVEVVPTDIGGDNSDIPRASRGCAREGEGIVPHGIVSLQLCFVKALLNDVFGFGI